MGRKAVALVWLLMPTSYTNQLGMSNLRCWRLALPGIQH